MAQTKLLVIGLDGGDPRLVAQWMEAGELPALAELAGRGVSTTLKSVQTLVSPSAWCSFATGVNPGKHGVYYFLDLIPGTYQLRSVNATHRRSPAFWELMSAAGQRVAVMNVQMTYPAARVNGVMIAGRLTPSVRSPGFTHPPELAERVLDICPQYPLQSEPPVGMAMRRPRWAAKALCRAIEQRTMVAEALLRDGEWDCGVVVFTETDIASHCLWHLHDTSHPDYSEAAATRHGDLMLDVYKAADRAVAALVGLAGPDTTVMVVSDHGAGPYTRGPLFLKSFLCNLGLCRLSHGLGREALGRTIRRGLGAVAGRVWATAKAFLPRRAVLHVVRKHRAAAEALMSAAVLGDIDWAGTKAFVVRLGLAGEVWVNERGRFPQGAVQPGRERDELLDFITERLYAASDAATGLPAVEAVIRKEDAFHGPYLDVGPDLLVHWHPKLVISELVHPGPDGNQQMVARPAAAPPSMGYHSLNGILLAAGPAIEANSTPEAEIVDIAPTVLHLAGLDVPSDLDGRVLNEMLRDEYRRLRTVQRTEAPVVANHDVVPVEYCDEDRQKIEKRLKDLGYL